MNKEIDSRFRFTMPAAMTAPVRSPAADAAEMMRVKALVKREFAAQFRQQKDIYEKSLAEMREQAEKDMKHMGYYTFDLVFQALLITLIDDFGFGTKEYCEKAGRIRRLHDKMQEYLGEYTARYDDHLSEGLTEQLRQRGLEYRSLEMQHKEEWK